MVGAHVRGAGHVAAGAPLGPGHHTTDARLDAAHHGAHAHRGAGADLLNGGGGAPGARLIEAGVGGAGDHLAGARFIAGHLGGAAGAGAAHHLGTVGDAEAHLGRLGSGAGSAEAVVLLAAHVLVAGDEPAGARFIAGHVLAAAHVGAGDARATQGVEAGHLGRSAPPHLVGLGDVLIAGELATRAGLIAGHFLGAAHHHAGDGASAVGLGLAHLAGGGGGPSAPGSRLIGRHVFGARDQLAGAGLIAGDLLGAPHLVAGDPVAMGGVADAHLGRLPGEGTALAEVFKHFGPEVFGAGDHPAGGGFVARGFGGAVRLGAGDKLATAGFAGAHFPGGIGGGGLAGAVAVRAGGAAATPIAGAGCGAHLALELAHLLGELAGAHVWVALTGHARRHTALRHGGRLPTLGEGLAAGQHECAAGVELGGALRGGAATTDAAGVGRVALAGPGAQVAAERAMAFAAVLAAAGAIGRRAGGLRLGSWRGWGDALAFLTGAVAGSVGALAAAGEGLATGEHKLAAGVVHRAGGAGHRRGGNGELGFPGPGRTGGGGRRRCGNSGADGGGFGRSRVGAGRSGVLGRAHATRGRGVAPGGFLAAVGEGLTALQGCFTTGCAGHIRPDERRSR